MSYHVGDTAPPLSGKVSTDLTGATARVHVRRPDGTILPPKDVTPVTTSATESTWKAPRWAVGDLSLPGNHQAEVEVTYADASVQTFGPDTFYVEPQIA